jgi:hypothetical protein
VGVGAGGTAQMRGFFETIPVLWQHSSHAISVIANDVH